ncbi:MAG: hypothetical protein RMJ98_02095 [Myxococcales bacterium]|nr:hypothetical protein [Polyangiaceae bacterium]MDW8248080.1 hypothetical protein [Myxococcales bacterium]
MRRLLLLLLLAACSSPAPPTPLPRPTSLTYAPSVPPFATPPQPSSSPPPPAFVRTPAAEEACRKIEDSSRQAMNRALAASEELQGDPVPDLTRTPCGCLDRTSWALAIEKANATSCKGGSCAQIRWHVAHVSPSGVVTAGPTLQDLVGGHPLRIVQALAYDWDSDGEPELFLRRSRAFFACGREAQIADERADVWTFHTNQVELYEPARRIAGEVGPLAASDEDGDGRPDLRVEGPFRATVPLPCGEASGAVVLAGHGWLARSLPGGEFSLTDDLARSEHRQACPRPPSPLILPSPKPMLVLAAAARNLACARAWGVSGQELREELEAGRASLCLGEPGRCPVFRELWRWTDLAAPTSLQ